MNITDFLDFVDAIKNIEKYEVQVKTLKDENTRLEQNIEATAKVSELTKLLAAAVIDKEQAAKLLKEAKTEATALKEAAKTSYEKKEAALSAREVAVNSRLSEASVALDQAAKLHADTETRLAKELADVHARKASLIAANQEVAERLEKLKSVMG